MPNYIGVKCPVCNKKFAKTDDIVVCPVCGAPHHRHCYAEKGECVFAAEHLDGKEWHAPKDEGTVSAHLSDEAGGAPGNQQSDARVPATKRCQSCGANNPQESIYCQICGNRLGDTASQQVNGGQARSNNAAQWSMPGIDMHFDPRTLVYGGMSPDDTIKEELVSDVAEYVGQNSAYYLPRFKMLSEGAISISANLSAILLSYFYFFYRKMYAIGAVLLAISLLTLTMNFLYVREMLPELIKDPAYAPFLAMMNQMNVQLAIPEMVNEAAAAFYSRLFWIMRVFNFGARISVALFANVIYYHKVIGSVSKIRVNNSELSEPSRYHTALTMQGGISNIALISGVVLTFIAYMFIYTIIFRGIM